MIAGRLEIELMANVARLTQDMAQAKNMVGSAMQSIEHAVAGAQRAFAMLGVGVGLASFAALVKSAINAGDELNKLSQKTGIAIGELSALKHVADLSGVSTESLAKGMKKLSEQMVEANDGTSKQAKLFKTLGIDINAGPSVALEKLATQFAGMRDGAVKTALATQLFGKAGQDLIPLLNQGADGVRKLKEEAHRLGLVWSEEAAKAAEQFNDNMRAIQKSSEGLATDLVNQMAPSLVAITNAMKEAAISGGVLHAVWVGMGGVLAELLGIGGTSAAVARVRDVEKEIIRLSDSIPDLVRESQIAQAKGAPSKGWDVAIKNTETQIRALQLAVRAVNGEFDDQVSRAARQGRGRPAGGASESAVRDALAADETASKKAHEERMRRAKAEIDAEEMFAKDYFEAWQAVYDQRNADAEKASKDRIALAAAEAKAEEMFAKDYQEAWEAYNQFLKKQGEERQAQTEQQMAVWTQLGDVAGNFFADLVMNGKSALDNLKRWVKELLAQMLALFAKRWILNIAGYGAAGTAGNVMGAAGAALGAGSDGSMAGNVLSAGSSLFSATGAIGAGWTAFSAGAQGATLAAGVAGPTTAGATGLMGMGNAMSGIYTALANIPVWGWIAMAVIAIGAWIAGKHKGGPKVGGSFMGDFDSSGAFAGSSAVPGSDNGRFYTPNQADSGVEQLVRGVGHGYAAALRQLGGTSGGMSFGLGFDHDPNGTAQSRVSSMVRDSSGRVVYRQQDMGMDDKEVPAALQLETQRMLFAALQASSLPDGVAQIINSLNVQDATADQINAALGLASAYQRLGDVIAAIEGGPVVALEQQLRGMKDAVDEAQIGLAEAILGGDHAQILAAEQALEQAIINRYNTEFEMIRNLQAAIRATEQAAYSFAMGMAQRINAVGGSVDIAGMAMGRATTLRGRVGGNAPIAHQVEDVQEYVGAIDSWYQSRRDQIERDSQAEMEAQRAINQAQATAWQQQAESWNARATQLQAELATVQQFQGIVDRTRQMIEQMRLTSLNPAGATARLGMVEDDLGGLRSAYAGASGSGRVTGANRLLDALQTRLGLLGEVFQRPSNEYQAGYNEIIAEITRLQGDAMTEAERGLALQEQIAAAQERAAAAQEMANTYASMTAVASEASRAALDALDAEARGYYTWAQAEGERLFGIQRQEQQTLIDTITGGMEPNLFIAQRSAEMVEELRGVREDLRNGLAAPQVTVNVTVDGDGDVSTETIVNAVARAGPQIKRILSTA